MGKFLKFSFAFILLCVAVGMVAAAVNPSPQGGSGPEPLNEMQLIVKFSPDCQLQIEHQLRDPGSTEFDYPPSVIAPTAGADGGARLWTVIESFRSRNGFGGMNRGGAVCHSRDDGTVVDLKFAKGTR